MRTLRTDEVDAMSEGNTRMRRIWQTASMAVLLLAVWGFRARPENPATGNGAMFRVQNNATPSGWVDIVIDVPLSQEGSAPLPKAVRYDAGGLDLDDITAPLRMRSQPSYAAPAPPVQMPRSLPSAKDRPRGIFDSASMDPYAKSEEDSDALSWGWLADDVNSAQRAEDSLLSTRRSSDRSYRFGSEENRTRDKRFGAHQEPAAGGRYFRREDRRF
jgi:hypothetical protein